MTMAFARCVEAISKAEKSTKVWLSGSFEPLLAYVNMKANEGNKDMITFMDQSESAKQSTMRKHELEPISDIDEESEVSVDPSVS